MKKFHRIVIIFTSCVFVGLLLVQTSQNDDHDDNEMWNGEDDYGFTWLSFFSNPFKNRNENGVAGLNSISCYYYRPMEDKNGNPQRFQLERPQTQLEARGCKKRMPHALVIGVKKCGTTAMGKYMGLHPLVSFSRSVQPGPQITDETIEEWKETFQMTSTKQMAFTGYPGLFNDMQPQLFQMARKYLPDDLKLILMLRDPVQRLISDYVHTVTIAERLEGDERKHYDEREGLKGSLEATVIDDVGHVNPFTSIVRLGIYSLDLRTLFRHIPRERILIIDGNAFSKDPFPSLLKVEKFLNLPPFFKRHQFRFEKEKHFHCAHVASRPDMVCLSSQKGRHHPDIDDALISKLYDFYRPHNQELIEEFGLEFSWSHL